MRNLNLFHLIQALMILTLFIPFSEEHSYLQLIKNYRLGFSKNSQSTGLNSKSLFLDQSINISHALFRKRLPQSSRFTSDPECQISSGSITFNSGTFSCSSHSHSGSNLIITGLSESGNNVEFTLNNHELHITLRGCTIKHPKPIRVLGSGTVNFYLDGVNTIFASSSGTPGPAIDCKSYNVIIKIKEAYHSDTNGNQLLVSGVRHHPAIGTNGECGTIRIESGYVEATGTVGDYSDSVSDPDNNQNYKASGAGIGTGVYGTINSIEIAGGIVIATGGKFAAGIGTGNNGYVKQITLTGGIIDAYGGEFGAGIGAGYGGRHKTSGNSFTAAHVDSITINGATVNAYSTKGRCEGAAIGGGYGRGYISSYVNNIYIQSGRVYAKVNDNGHGAAIGGGNARENKASFVNNIEITGGIVIALGPYDAAAIGYGRGEYNVNEQREGGSVDTLKITCGIEFLYAKSGNSYSALSHKPGKNMRYVTDKQFCEEKISCNSDKRICGYPSWDISAPGPAEITGSGGSGGSAGSSPALTPTPTPTPLPAVDTLPVCYLTEHWANYQDENLHCNGNTNNYHVRNFIVDGPSYNGNSMYLYPMNEDVHIHLRNVNIEAIRPFIAKGTGTIYVYFQGTNRITSITDGEPSLNVKERKHPGIHCASENISIVFNEEPGTDSSLNKLIVRANNDRSNAGIGTHDYCNTLKFESGYIEATGKTGKFTDSEDHKNCDGEFKDFEASGAGIGSSTYGTIQNIEITGGTIVATGGKYGAGIGCGYYGDIKNIIISGGNVTAYGGQKAAGIGTGYGGRQGALTGYKVSLVVNIYITGGIVNAYATESSSYGAAIGAGYGKGRYSSTVQNIIISGGDVYAMVSSDGSGAAIGGGYGYAECSSYVNNIEIIGGNITAIGPSSACGIGYGHGHVGSPDTVASMVSTLIISDFIDSLYASSLHDHSALGQQPNSNGRYVDTPCYDDYIVCNEIETECIFVKPIPPTNPFTHSSSLKPTPQFSASAAFSLSNQFSQSSSFSFTNAFSQSSSFSFSNLFSESSTLKSSKYYTQSSSFSFSNVFTQSSSFSFSNIFSQSSSFSFSNHFSQSSSFSFSHVFSESSSFSFSNVFSESSSFSFSNQFSQSSSFSLSNAFSESSTLKSSKYYTQSSSFSFTSQFSDTTKFSISKTFSESSSYTASNNFSPTYGRDQTHYFTKSSSFTATNSFTPSSSLKPSRSFTESAEFSLSAPFSESSSFSSSHYFSLSPHFSESSSFESSLYFSTSASFTGSNTLKPKPTTPASLDPDASNPFSASSSFKPSESFTESTSFNPSEGFTESNNFNPSEGFTGTSKFSLSHGFTESTSFNPSKSFTESHTLKPPSTTQFTESERFSASKSFKPSKTYTPSHQFTPSVIPTPSPSPTPVPISAVCICESKKCRVKQGYVCIAIITKVIEVLQYQTEYIYIDKARDYHIDLTEYTKNITIVINLPSASFLVEHGNSILPLPYHGGVSLVIFNSLTFITSDDKTITFISDYDNKIRFKVKKSMNIIIPEQKKQEPTIDFQFPLTFDFSEGADCSLNFKSVDDSGTLEDLSVSGKSSSPTMTYVGSPANLEVLDSLGSFVHAETEEEETNEVQSAGLSTSSIIAIVISIIALVVIILIASLKRRRDQASKVSPILPIDE